MTLTIKCAILRRVSTVKQFYTNDSTSDQSEICSQVVNRMGLTVAKVFELAETGDDSIGRPDFQEVLNYCKNPKNQIRYLVFKSIDRFTRGGDGFYFTLKAELAKYGIEIIDAYGIIQPSRNTLEHLGVKYDWSIYSPSETAEAVTAHGAKTEKREILSRVIGAEIVYTRLGYGARGATFGFKSERNETEHGKRLVWIANPPESDWIVKLFTLRCEGRLTDKEIIDEINKEGFKTRISYTRDKKTKQVIGRKGGNPLKSVKQLERLLQNPTYAGFFCEKWTDYQPVKTKFDGLVSIDTFNKANRGKVALVAVGPTYQLVRNFKQIKRLKFNPTFPYKFILCPLCRKSLLGSAPRSKSGKHIPRYHCDRKHKYLSINQKTFNETIEGFIKQVKFSEDFKLLFRQIIVDTWNAKRQELLQNSVDWGKRVIELENEKQLLVDRLKAVTSPVATKALEDELDKNQFNLIVAKENRDKGEHKELEIEEMVNYATYFMEHLDKLLFNTGNVQQEVYLFKSLFEELPTYEEIKNGTPKLACCFSLNQNSTSSKEQLVSVFNKIRTHFKSSC